jgi:hypothetical protein
MHQFQHTEGTWISNMERNWQMFLRWTEGSDVIGWDLGPRRVDVRVVGGKLSCVSLERGCDLDKEDFRTSDVPAVPSVLLLLVLNCNRDNPRSSLWRHPLSNSFSYRSVDCDSISIGELQRWTHVQQTHSVNASDCIVGQVWHPAEWMRRDICR